MTASRTAAARTATDVSLGTLTSEPGGFGAAIGRLGFGPMVDGTTWDSVYYRTDHPAGVRVVCYPQDGDRVLLLGWHEGRIGVEAWRVEFSGSTPQSIVLAAIANALGHLPVTH